MSTKDKFEQFADLLKNFSVEFTALDRIKVTSRQFPNMSENQRVPSEYFYSDQALKMGEQLKKRIRDF